jgi:hypothetical protein
MLKPVWCKERRFLVVIFSIPDSIPLYLLLYLLTPSRPHDQVLSGLPYLDSDCIQTARFGFIMVPIHI